MGAQVRRRGGPPPRRSPPADRAAALRGRPPGGGLPPRRDPPEPARPCPDPRHQDGPRARRIPPSSRCFVHADLRRRLRPLPIAGVPPPALQARVGFRVKTAAQLPLATSKVRYVGEPVAVVVATDAYAAEDALDLIDVDYEPLAAGHRREAGLAPGRRCSTRRGATTWASRSRRGSGDADRALAGAPVRVSARIRVPRYAGCRSSRAASWPSRRRAATASPCGRRPRCRTGSSARSARRWICRRTAAGRRARRRRRVRDEGFDLPGGRPDPGDRGPARPPGEVDRDAARAPPERDPLAGAAPRRRARRRPATA